MDKEIKVDMGFITEDKKEYRMMFRFDKTLLPDTALIGEDRLSHGIEVLLGAFARSIRKVVDIPFFIDVDREVDGSKLGCHFNLDKKRVEDLAIKTEKYFPKKEK